MLVLSRKPEQRILIGDDIVIVVCKIQGDRVIIGLDCPKSIPVLRGELVPSPGSESRS